MSGGRKRTLRLWRHRVVGTVLVVLALWVIAYAWGLQVYRSYREAQIHGQVAMVEASTASALGSALNQRLALVRGLAAFVSVKARESAEDYDAEMGIEFPRFAEAYYQSVPGLRNLAVAPDFVVRMVYPDDVGNHRVIGNDLLADKRPGFAEAVRRAIASRGVTVHEPVELIQGGRGLLARQAVFVGDHPWGAVGVVFEIAPMIEACGLPASRDFAWGVRTSAGTAVGGDQGVFALDPVVTRIALPEGYWEMALLPAEGWSRAAVGSLDYILVQGGLVLLGGLAMLTAVGVSVRRHRLEYQVLQRTAALTKAQRALRRHARELGEAHGELERFAYVAAHDLQEPLRQITSFSQLVSRTYQDILDDEGRAWLSEVVTGAARMRLLLRDIQLFLAESTLPLPTGPVPAAEAVAVARQKLAQAIADSGARVEVGALPEVQSDSRRLSEVMQVLIGNAIEYRHPDRAPVVRIEAREEEGFHIIEVEDNGIGIEAEYHQRIFEVLQRLHGRAAHPGTGMGLAIAQKMIHRLGGRITVRSQPGEGSIFSVYLPVA